MPINGVALAAVGTGSILIWSGIKGWNLTQTFGEVITGKVPQGSNVNALVNPNSFSGGNASGGFGGSASGLVNAAMQYKGHAYLFGGAPGKNGANPWDCSSFVNWVVSHDLHKAIPGYGPGQYDGSVHGPPTGSWAIWPGMVHVKNPQAGDIVVWAGHMGIVIGPNQMISALGHAYGTVVTAISGHGNGPLICYGRLK